MDELSKKLNDFADREASSSNDRVQRQRHWLGRRLRKRARRRPLVVGVLLGLGSAGVALGLAVSRLGGATSLAVIAMATAVVIAVVATESP